MKGSETEVGAGAEVWAGLEPDLISAQHSNRVNRPGMKNSWLPLSKII